MSHHISNIVLIFHFNDETKLQIENPDHTLALGNEGEDYGLTGLMAILAKILGSEAARKAAIEGAKAICEATGGMDYADSKKSWTDWAEEYLGDAGFILKTTAIAAAKLFCKSL